MEEYTYEKRSVYGYKYPNESDAINARQAAATYAGFPVPGGTTLYWVNYEKNQYDDFWYIIHVENLEIVLGEPIQFEITVKIYRTTT